MAKIVTHCEFPPIPDRRWDWVAYWDGRAEGDKGWGATEDEAIADLLDNSDDPDYEPEAIRRRELEAEARHCGGLSPLGEALARELIAREA